MHPIKEDTHSKEPRRDNYTFTMKCAAVVVLLSLLSLGHSAPQSICDSLLKPINFSKEELLGRWTFIAGTSNIPGSRSLSYLMTSIWVNVAETSQSNEIYITQNQKILGQCSSLAYNLTFENSAILIEQPFYLKQVYLSTDCADCLVAKEDIASGTDAFTSLLMFSRSKSVSPASFEKLKKQAECLGMKPPMTLDPSNDTCPDNLTPSEGISTTKSVLDFKMGLMAAKFLDTVFDLLVN